MIQVRTKVVPNSKWAGYEVEPLGVIYKIVPFNFPAWISFKVSVPTLAVGNSVLLRPANSTPLVGEVMSEIFSKAGIDHRIKIIHSSPADTDFIMAQPEVHGLSFTGSTAASKLVAVSAAKNLKRSVIEAGGSDPFILFEDADIKRSVETTILARLINAG